MLKFPYLPLPYYFISIIAFAIHRILQILTKLKNAGLGSKSDNSDATGFDITSCVLTRAVAMTT